MSVDDHRRHDEQAEEECESRKHLVRRDGRQREGVTGHGEHDEDLGE